jgi:lantibiotic biosynthesis protein
MSNLAERPAVGNRRRSAPSANEPGARAADLANCYRAADFFVVRSPILPFSRLLDWCGDAPSVELEAFGLSVGCDWAARRAQLSTRLRAVFAAPSVQRALYFASPDLEAFYRGTEALTPSLIRTLTRYFMRLSGRETPFGLFAGVSLAAIAEKDCFELGPEHDNRSATSVSVGYLSQILSEVGCHPARDSFRYSLTSTLVRVDGRYRFTTNEPAPLGSGSEQPSCVVLDLAATPQVDRAVALAARGITLEELARGIAGKGIQYGDALQFARTLAQRGFLVPDLLPGATSGSALATALPQLREHPDTATAARALSQVDHALSAADASSAQLGSQPFREAAAQLNQLRPCSTGIHPLRTALSKPAPRMAMSQTVAQLFLDAASLLQRTQRPPNLDALRDFRHRFRERYDTRLVPLAEVLDTEVGIGVDESRASDPLLKDVPVPGSPSPEQFDDFDRVRLKLVQRALSRGSLVCELDDETLAEFPERESLPHWAESFVIVARLAQDESGKLSVVAPGIVPSTLKMLARFCEAEPRLTDVLRRQAASEQQLAGEALLADVSFLPNNEAANIVVRPVLRDYEIPYLSKSGAPAETQIPFSDLSIQLRGERFELYSTRLGRPVKIRISNALNHKHEANPQHYRFLAELEVQDQASLPSSWSWGALRSSEFLPRVVRGSTVLCLARWQLSGRELEPAIAAEGAQAFHAMQQLRKQLRLPRWLTRGLGDQRLPIDLDNELSVEELLHDARKLKSLVLEEMRPTPDQLVLNGPEGKYAGEFVVPFVRRAPLPATNAMTLGAGSPRKRRYPPGSDWLYAKIYAAPSRMNAILTRVESAVLGPLRDAGIESWYYLPFADPHPHLRVRFKGAAGFLHRRVLPALEAALEPELNGGGVWRLQLDTYAREQERYGGPRGAELAERLFAADSDACSKLVELSEPHSDLRWQIALLGIDRLFCDCKFDLTERLLIAREASEAYAKEPGSADAATWHAIGVKYRAHTARLSQLLSLTLERAQGQDQQALRILALRSSAIRPIWRSIERARRAGLIHASATDLARSFAHMHAIRLLGVEARAHELVLFDFLKRLYQSRLAQTPRPASTRESIRNSEHARAKG